MPIDYQNEANALRAMLGLPSAPVLLDIKPPDLLTEVERERFKRRLAEVDRKLLRRERWGFWQR